MEKKENFNVLFQVHLFFTFFLFLLLPQIANHFAPDLSESVLLTIALINGLFGLALCISEGRILMPFKPALVFFYLFGLFVILHYFFSFKSEEGRQFVNGIILIMLFTFNVSQACRTKKIALLFICGIVINGLLQSIIGFNQHFYSLPELQELILKNPQVIQEYSQGNNDLRFLERINGRLSFGSFIYPNTLGAYLGLVLFALAALFLVIKERALPTLLNWLIPAFGVLALTCIYFTGAKGVWISLAVIFTLAVITFWAFKKHKVLDFKFYLNLGFCLMAGIIAAPFLFKNMLSMKVRLNYWRAGLDMFLQESSYWIGLNAGGFTNHYMKYKLPFGEEVQKAHNYFVTVLVEQGIFGLILFLLFLGSLFYWFMKSNHMLTASNNSNDTPMPRRVYLVLFFIVFAIFMSINPVLTNISSGLSILTLYALIILFLILSFRFLINKNVFKSLKIEQNLPFQNLILCSCLVICFIDVVNAYLKLDHWPNFQELNENFPAITILILLFLFFFLINKKNQNNSVAKKIIFLPSKILGILLIVFFTLMIGGDMVGEYSSFVITFIALAIILEKNSFDIQNEISFNSIWATLFFVILSFGFVIFIFEKFVMPDINIARYHYKYEHWMMEGGTKNDGIIEGKEGILETGQMRYPDHLFFPLEKAKIYSAIGKKYLNQNLKRNTVQWNNMAIKELDLCIKIAPKKANLYDFKADLMEEIDGEFQEIEKVRLQALESYPTKAKYHYQLGNFYRKANKVEKALKYFNNAIHLQKNSNRYTILNKEEYEDALRYKVENEQKTDYNSKSE